MAGSECSIRFSLTVSLYLGKDANDLFGESRVCYPLYLSLCKVSDVEWIASLHLILLLGEATPHAHTCVELLSLRITHSHHILLSSSPSHRVKWIGTSTASHSHLLVSHKWILSSHHHLLLLGWHLLLLHEWIHASTHTTAHATSHGHLLLLLLLLLHHGCLELILHGLSHHIRHHVLLLSLLCCLE